MTPPVRSVPVPVVALVIWSVATRWTNALWAQSPRITEFLAINEENLADEDGDHPDWIEIHNPAALPVSLDGWALTDTVDEPRKWTFPAIDLAGGAFLVVFASGKSRASAVDDDDPELHASFKLRGEGEYLALVGPDGRVVDEYFPEYPPQRADVSYGVDPGGGGERRYFGTPTPGGVNDTAGPSGFVADTKFSVDRGFYDEPVMVEITTATPDAEIRFTLDGTTPTSTRGEVYSGPILVERTTILRAAAFRSGLTPTGVDTHTYIYVDDVVRQDHESALAAGFPPTWGTTEPDYGLDPRVAGPDGADAFGGKYARSIRDDLKAVPTVSIVMNIDDLFGAEGIYTHATERGVEWERPASVELIHPDGRPGFEVGCGVRIHGGAFRSHLITRKHSLRLLFKGIYGSTKLRFPWFDEGATDEFDSIVLRAGSGDGWQWDGAGSRPLYVRDSFARATVREMGGVAAHGTFVHVYINGIYWGLYNAVERPDASFSAAYYGGDQDDWDAISSGDLSSGSLDAWNTMTGIARAGLADAASYRLIQGQRPDGTDDPSLEDYLDMESLADYMIANLYIGNTDWPRKNYWASRNRHPDEGGAPDGRGFKLHAWDSEWSIGLRSDLSTDRIAVSDGAAVAWPHVRENAEFRVLFGDRVHRHFSRGGALHVDASHPEWDPENPGRNAPAARFMRLCGLIDRALVPESARWGDQHRSPPYTRDEHWRPERDDLLANYFPYRSTVVLAQFRSSGLYPKLDAPELDPRGGRFTSSFTALITVPAGRAYYTLDGTDPRLTGGAVSPRAVEIPARERTPILSPGAPARILVPGDGSLDLDWTRSDFDDSSWRQGRTAVGYERSSGFEDLIGADVEEDLYGRASSVYLRIPFVMDRLGARTPILTMKYDDGFVAYLNGQRIIVANAPDAPRWDSVALALRPDSLARRHEEFDLSEHAALFREGLNVLAIHGMNHTTTSSDLLFLPQLELLDPFVPEAIVLTDTTVVKARAWDGGEWSALAEATFVDTSLRITEIMYHPSAPPPGPDGTRGHDGDDYEFIEIENVGDSTARLRGVRLAGGIVFDFSLGDVPSLAPEGFLVVVKNRAAFASIHGSNDIAIAGEYDGSLSNGGEALRLEGPHGAAILHLTYDDAWYRATDGAGHSLVIVDPRADPDTWSESINWTASRLPGGSPGRREDETVPPYGWQLVGDANQDGRLDISDVVALLRLLFDRDLSGSGPCAAPGNLSALDWNADRIVDLSDAVSLLSAFFAEGYRVEGSDGCARIEGCPTVCTP